jgi:hypothetical protein
MKNKDALLPAVKVKAKPKKTKEPRTCDGCPCLVSAPELGGLRRQACDTPVFSMFAGGRRLDEGPSPDWCPRLMIANGDISYVSEETSVGVRVVAVHEPTGIQAEACLPYSQNRTEKAARAKLEAVLGEGMP